MELKELLNGQEVLAKLHYSIKELPTKGLKKFEPDYSWLEKKHAESKKTDKFNFMDLNVIEKSNNISLAEWIPYKGKAKVLKKIGKIWEILGHHEDNEDWLFPEEVLFLVEKGELQLILDEVYATIEDCYALLYQDDQFTEADYRAYCLLCRVGFKVVRHDPSLNSTFFKNHSNISLVLEITNGSTSHDSTINNITDQDENEIMIIDEDVKECSKPPGESIENQNTKSANKNDNDIIEIEDDDLKVEELIDESSSDSSDVICISSPSYEPTTHSREWYPPSKKSLLVAIEKVIDISGDNDFMDEEKTIFDLVKISKTEVLSYLPSAENGVSVLLSPDIRLIPRNIVPKYSEYKVNLNVREEDNYSRPFYQPGYSFMPRMPTTNMIGRPCIPQLSNNPIYKKVEEMQAMAMSMIHTASTMMSALGTQNPNELWNLTDGRPYPPRFHPLQQPRPYYNHPRRYFRHSRRRYPFYRRGGNRYHNRSYDHNIHSNTFHFPNGVGNVPGIKSEVVELSDDEEIEKETNCSFDASNEVDGKDRDAKRKGNDLDSVSIKKLKTEETFQVRQPGPSLTTENTSFQDIKILEESSESKDFTSSSLSKTNDNSDQMKTTTEMESEDTSDGISVDKYNQGSTKNEAKKPDSKKSFEQNITIDITDSEEATTKVSSEVIIIIDEANAVSSTNKKLSESKDDAIGSGDNVISLSDSEMEIEITCWKEFKNKENSHDLVTEDSFNKNIEPLIQFEESMSYGKILSTIQIFKEVDSTRVERKFQIKFDLYVPDANFKKSEKILPNYRVIVSRSKGELLNGIDLKYLKDEYCDQIPFLFCAAFHDNLAFYLYDTLSLPTMID